MQPTCSESSKLSKLAKRYATNTTVILYCYYVISSLLQIRELIKGFGIYIKYVDLKQAEQTSKNTVTGLMRALMSIWYSRERLAIYSAINTTIKTCISSRSMHVVCLYLTFNIFSEYCEETTDWQAEEEPYIQMWRGDEENGDSTNH